MARACSNGSIAAAKEVNEPSENCDPEAAAVLVLGKASCREIEMVTEVVGGIRVQVQAVGP